MIEYPDDVAEIIRRFGGVGERLGPAHVAELWEEYSATLCASWLIVNDHTFGGFCAWLADIVLQTRTAARSRTL